jgi:hypothetical protein
MGVQIDVHILVPNTLVHPPDVWSFLLCMQATLADKRRIDVTWKPPPSCSSTQGCNQALPSFIHMQVSMHTHHRITMILALTIHEPETGVENHASSSSF